MIIQVFRLIIFLNWSENKIKASGVIKKINELIFFVCTT